MDELLNGYATSTAAYAAAVQELRSLSQMRHTRSAYLAALAVVEKYREECELARLDFGTPAKAI
jgi:hypothetical protein